MREKKPSSPAKTNRRHGSGSGQQRRSSSSGRKVDPHTPAPIAPPPEALIDLKALCQFLGLGRTKVLELITQEGLPVYRFGSAYRFDRLEVWQWLQQRRAEHTCHSS